MRWLAAREGVDYETEHRRPARPSDLASNDDLLLASAHNEPCPLISWQVSCWCPSRWACRHTAVVT